MTTQVNFNILNSDKDAESFSAGQKIFSAGDTGEAMYFVKSGNVAIVQNGNEIISVGAGEIFGEMALIDSKPRSADAIAKTDCEVVAINEKYFTFLVQEHPFFALNVMRVLVSRLKKTA